MSSGRIQTMARWSSWTHAPLVPMATETELWSALVMLVLGAGTGEVGMQAPGSFAIKKICVAGECEVSWERPFYWAPDAVE